MESVCVCVYVRVLKFFSVGSRTGRRLIFGMLGAIDIGNLKKASSCISHFT